MLKKRYLFLIIIVCLFAISTVSAEEINNETNIVISSYDSGLTTDSVNVCDISNAKEIQESANNGTFTDLQKKIDDAPVGSTITLEKDYIYNPGFSANGITINKELTIKGNGYTIDALGQSRIFNITSAITLDNIIFKNGKVNGAWYGGGAIRAYGCSIDIMNSMFIGNSAYYGGAISSTNGVSVKNCIFKDNKADGSGLQQCLGGAIYSSADDVKVDNSTFIGNYAHDYGGAIYAKSVHTNSKSSFINNTAADNDGGAIYTESVYIVDSTFEGNVAYQWGGAIYNVNGIIVKNSIFKNNRVEGASVNQCEGGAIYTQASGDVRVDNSTFIGNQAKDYGGAISGYASFYVSSSTFIGNDAADNDGGAIYAKRIQTLPSKQYVMKIVDSIFDSNHAYEDGGAIYTTLINVNVKNSTFRNNRAEGASVNQCEGGAIACQKTTDYYGTYTLNIDNSTFIGNHAYDYGGAIYADAITWVNTPSYFINNYVNDNQGGAIYTNTFNSEVSNAVFIGNEVKANDDGGAIYINNKNKVTFTHCTFKDNKCGDEGGAIYLDSTSSELTLKDHNSFVNNHAGDEGHDVFNKGYYGTISGNWWGTPSPDFNNGQLIEWKHWPYSNIKHKDSAPLQSSPDEYGYRTVLQSQTLNEDYITEVCITGSQYQETFYDTEHNVLANELISFNINNVTYYRTTDENGVASLNIRLTPGIYTIKSKNPVTGEIVYKKINIDSKIVNNKDLIKYYKNGSQFEVTILTENGSVVGAGETVTFNVNGVTYTRTTDANGKAALNINLGPGDYTITTEYKGVKDSNKIIVLPVLYAEDLTKKVGASDQFVAKLLDGQGKVLAGETLTFNINGVYYQSISDSEGYAKLNIDLIPGEYIITSSYNGANVANKITITG